MFKQLTTSLLSNHLILNMKNIQSKKLIVPFKYLIKDFNLNNMTFEDQLNFEWKKNSVLKKNNRSSEEDDYFEVPTILPLSVCKKKTLDFPFLLIPIFKIKYTENTEVPHTAFKNCRFNKIKAITSLHREGPFITGTPNLYIQMKDEDGSMEIKGKKENIRIFSHFWVNVLYLKDYESNFTNVYLAVPVISDEIEKLHEEQLIGGTSLNPEDISFNFKIGFRMEGALKLFVLDQLCHYGYEKDKLIEIDEISPEIMREKWTYLDIKLTGKTINKELHFEIDKSIDGKPYDEDLNELCFFKKEYRSNNGNTNPSNNQGKTHDDAHDNTRDEERNIKQSTGIVHLIKTPGFWIIVFVGISGAVSVLYLSVLAYKKYIANKTNPVTK